MQRLITRMTVFLPTAYLYPALDFPQGCITPTVRRSLLCACLTYLCLCFRLQREKDKKKGFFSVAAKRPPKVFGKPKIVYTQRGPPTRAKPRAKKTSA